MPLYTYCHSSVHIDLKYSVYSRSISFFSWWRTQWRVGESGQPISVCRQHEHTEASRVKARHSELMDLPGLHGRQSSSSSSKSVWYSIKYALISTASSISTGRSLIDVYSNNIISQSQHQHHFKTCDTIQSVHASVSANTFDNVSCFVITSKNYRTTTSSF